MLQICLRVIIILKNLVRNIGSQPLALFYWMKMDGISNFARLLIEYVKKNLCGFMILIC